MSEEYPSISSIEQAEELLDRAVALRGEDYVYPGTMEASDSGEATSCFYVHGPNALPYSKERHPGCIVGVALNLAGFSLEFLEQFDRKNNGAMAIYEFLSDRSASEQNYYAWRVLFAAQKRQDNGEKWGDAVRAAKQAEGSESYDAAH